jgi:hypothetical protein
MFTCFYNIRRSPAASFPVLRYTNAYKPHKREQHKRFTSNAASPSRDKRLSGTIDKTGKSIRPTGMENDPSQGIQVCPFSIINAAQTRDLYHRKIRISSISAMTEICNGEIEMIL